MPTRKQRRRQAKDRRHEYEYVYVDDQGQEVEVDEDERAPRQGRPAKAGVRPNAKREAGRQSAAASSRGREVKPPSWDGSPPRLIFAPIMLVVVYC
jgi:hypothetical protein